jgi:2-keto-4-pentenoate hydratase/2-oxohepta-3-ene-1,7-dioic acid hydratase in catechol pathway
MRMKFVSFRGPNGAAVPGLVVEEGGAPSSVVDLPKAFALAGVAAPWRDATPSLLNLIEAGDASLDAVKDVARPGRRDRLAKALVPWKDVQLLAPLPQPRKNVFCVGRNYVDHVAEGYRARGQDLKLPEHPQFFTKPPTAVIGPDAAFHLDPRVTEKLDYEVELAIVIGTKGRDIPADRVYDHVFGYTIVNDITGRDLQRRHDQWFKGKGLDESCPMGPWIVHKSAIPDPQKLDIACFVNGEERQHANTAQMIFDLKRIVADLSKGMTLEPGDVIATGTPSGVGYAMDPPGLLKAGDVVECRIEGIGRLVTTIAAR